MCLTDVHAGVEDKIKQNMRSPNQHLIRTQQTKIQFQQ